MATLIFFRPESSPLYLLRKASISIDGEKVGALGRGRWLLVNIPPGERRIRVRNWDSAGSCELVLRASADSRYYFQVDPRQESFGAFAAGDVPGTALGKDIWIGLASGLLTEAGESYGRDCGGLFHLYPADPDYAEGVIEHLSRIERRPLSE